MFLLTRHENGPILVPDSALPWEKEGVFNPGIARMGNEIIMLYRAVGETESYISRLGIAKSDDGVVFKRLSKEPVFGPKESFDMWATEDPRITKIGDDFFITYVAVGERIMQDGKPFPRSTPINTVVALLKTKDFISFDNLGIISPENSNDKDMVIFPRKIKGRYCMLHRPTFWDKPWYEFFKNQKKNIDLPFKVETLPDNPGIWLAWSDNLKNWTDHQIILHSSHREDSKIGPGLPPIETKDGWLVIYHHVITTPDQDSFFYSVRAALFDIDDPTRLISKIPYDILVPEMPYEQERTSSIVFPTGGFISNDTLYVYYGASDRYVGLATGSLSELLSELDKFKSK